MKAKLGYFLGAALAATLLLLGVAAGERSAYLRAYQESRGLLVARSLAWLTSEQLSREEPGELLASFLNSADKSLPEVEQALVLKNTKLIAHTDPARAGQKLNSESLEDKALYDLAAGIKATVRKNVEERERNPALQRDAYSVYDIKQTRFAHPAVRDGDMEALAEVVIAGQAESPSLPWMLLLFALAGTALYAVFASRLSGLALAAAGSTLLVTVVLAQVLTLASWRGELRREHANGEAELITRLVKSGLFTGASNEDRGELVHALDRGKFGEPLGALLFIRSATVAVSNAPSGVDIDQGGVITTFSNRFFDEGAARDRRAMIQWGSVIAIFSLILLNLGLTGRLLAAWRSFVAHRSAYKYLAPAAIGLFVLVFIPVTYGIVLGFFSRNYGVWEFVGVDNFIGILSNFDISNVQSFYFKLAVTILWTVSNVGLHVGIGLFLALLLNDPILKAKGLFRVLLIVPWAVPNYITALIWRGLFHKQFGAINFVIEWLGFEPISWFQTFWPAFATNLATNVWLGFPFMMVTSLGALQSIPSDLYEAAIVDGANRWQRFWKITLPLLMPALVPAVIVGSVWTFNMFNIIYLVSGGAPDGATDILITDAFRWAFERDQHGYAAAYSTLIFLILVAFTMTTNRVTKATKGAFE